MSSNWEKIKQEYLESGGKINLKTLAEKYHVKYETLRSRKRRKNWDDELNHEKSCPNALLFDQPSTRKGSKKDAPATDRTDKGGANAPKNAPENGSNGASKNSNKAEGNSTILPEEDIEENKALTRRQVIFCREFIKDFNGTRSAIEAGYSKKSARQIAYENLTKPYIQAEIQKQMKKLIHSLEISATRIVMEYAKIAFSDITLFMEVGRKKKTWVDKKGKKQSAVVDYAHLKKGTILDGSLIQEIKSTDYGLSIKLYDKMKALEALAKIAGLFNDEHKKMIEIEKLKVLQEKLKLEQARNTKNTDNGNLDDMIKSLEAFNFSNAPLQDAEEEEEGVNNG